VSQCAFMCHAVRLCVPVYLETNFDETLHVAQACPEEGYRTTGTSGYSPVQFLEPKDGQYTKCPDVRICPLVRKCPDLCSLCPDLYPMSGFVSHVRICVHYELHCFLRH